MVLESANPTQRPPSASRRRQRADYRHVGGTRRLTVTLPDVVLLNLAEMAEREGRSMSDIAAEAIITRVGLARWGGADTVVDVAGRVVHELEPPG